MISDQLNKVGIKTIGFGCDAKPEQLPEFSYFNEDVGAVVVGMDYNISFNKLVKACTNIEKFNCLFIASNYDKKMPNPELTVPGPGAILTLIEKT